MAKVRSYDGQGITVRYDVRRCIHAAECVKGLPAVFDAERRPWIDASAAPADRVAEVVERCPTGALTYLRSDGGPDEAAPETPEVRVERNGPLYVRGRIELCTPEGGAITTCTRAALCRCGASKNKPYCDGTHSAIGFQG